MSDSPAEQFGLQLLNIESNTIAGDRKFLFDMAIALSELHARFCTEIGRCGDMEKTTMLGDELKEIHAALDKVNEFADEAKDFDAE